MHVDRTDPGDCPICGTAHCSCCGGGSTAVVQLPNRDAAAAGETAVADGAVLGDGSDDRPFSTSSYRGKKRGSSSRP